MDGFVVLYRRYDDDDDYRRLRVAGSEARQAVLRSLDSDTTYSIVIHSFNRHGPSQLSNTVVMTTLASTAGHHHHHGLLAVFSSSSSLIGLVIIASLN